MIVTGNKNHYITGMKNSPALSIATREILSLLAAQLELARRERGMTQTDLAERAGISINTLKSVLQGKPQVAIGTVFEIAAILRVSLYDPRQQSHEKALIDTKLKLLPGRVHRQKAGIDDDF